MARRNRTRPPRTKTPLRRYLDSHPGLSASEVGNRMAPSMDGAVPSSASLSQWSTGVQAPSARAQLAMAAATEGEVTPGDWARWRAEVERQAKPKRKRCAR